MPYPRTLQSFSIDAAFTREIRVIQSLLGYQCIVSTMRSSRVDLGMIRRAQSPLAQIDLSAHPTSWTSAVIGTRVAQMHIVRSEYGYSRAPGTGKSSMFAATVRQAAWRQFL